MKKKLRLIISFFITLFTLTTTGCSIIYPQENNDPTTKILSTNTCSNLEVYYIDLKNANDETVIGDSTYIKCGDIDIVIDAGKQNPGSNTVVPFLKEHVTDKKIELLIATHTDSDHIGGFVGLSTKEGVLSIEEFTYEYIIDSGFVTTTTIYTKYMNLVNNSGAKVCTAYDSLMNNNGCYKSFKIGNITLDIVDTSLYNSNTDEPNDRSIVTLLTYNDVNFLFPGDLLDDEYLATTIGHIDIFKASHHGASSANSQELLNAMTPDVIILSADGTSYDIPQQDTIDRIYSLTNEVEVYATFTSGTIKITTDGNTYNITCPNKILFEDTDWFAQNRTLN